MDKLIAILLLSLSFTAHAETGGGSTGGGGLGRYGLCLKWTDHYARSGYSASDLVSFMTGHCVGIGEEDAVCVVDQLTRVHAKIETAAQTCLPLKL
jgi:hypothetical protein